MITQCIAFVETHSVRRAANIFGAKMFTYVHARDAIAFIYCKLWPQMQQNPIPRTVRLGFGAKNIA